MKKVEVLDIPIYCTSVCFLIGGGKEDLDLLKEDNPDKFDHELYYSLLKDIEDVDICDGFTVVMRDGSYLVYIREGFEDVPRVVIHELFHLANYILYKRGVYHEESAEPWAYLLGWLTEQYVEIIREQEEESVEPKNE